MAGVSAANSIAAALRTQSAGPVEEQVFRNNDLMRFFRMEDMTGGSTYNWKNNYSGNTSVDTYEEGDSFGEAGSQSYITASAPVAYYKMKIGITGHAMDQLRNGASTAAFFDQWAMEYSEGLKDLVDKITTDMLSTGLTAPVGIQGWIDSSGTIAGLDRGTYTWFAALEANAAGTTIAVSDLDNHDYQIRDADRGGAIELWMTSPKQLAKYKGVAGQIGIANNSVRVTVGPNGVELNSGMNWDGQKHGSAPIVAIRDLTNSIWLGLSGLNTLWLIARQRAVTVKEIATPNDNQEFLITCAYGLVCRQPRKQTKVANLTA